jgi:hypothetical protein
MCGVTLFRGLNTAASITIKFIVGLEIQPNPISPVRQFVVPAAEYEPKALQLYAELIRDMPQAYDARANFLGAVLAAASTLLPMIMPHVSGIIRSFRGEPEQKQVESVTQRVDQPEMRVASVSAMPPVPSIVRKQRARSVSTRASSRASHARVKVVKPRKKHH